MPASTTSAEGSNSSWSCFPLKSSSKNRPWSRRISRILHRDRNTSSPTEPKRLSDSSSEGDSSTDAKPLTTEKQAEGTNDGNTELSTRIFAIISRYKLPTKDNASQESNTRLVAQIDAQVSRSQPILMCLPAFPFKSPNTSSKVLGYLPDKADEVALAHLNGLCAAISQIYEHGARLMIISDGLVYNGTFVLLTLDDSGLGTDPRRPAGRP